MGADRDYSPLPPDHQRLLDFALAALKSSDGFAQTLMNGATDTVLQRQTSGFAAVSDTLRRHGGPCDRALLDVVWAYVLAPESERAALFLALASRAVGGPSGINRTADGGQRPDQPPSPKTCGSDDDQEELLAWARSTLGLLSRLTQRSGS